MNSRKAQSTLSRKLKLEALERRLLLRGEACGDISGILGLTEPLDLCDAVLLTPAGEFWDEMVTPDPHDDCTSAESFHSSGVEIGRALEGTFESTAQFELISTDANGNQIYEFTYVATPVAGFEWLIQLFEPNWPGQTPEQEAAVSDYMDALRAHEEGHMNVWASVIASYRPRATVVLLAKNKFAKDFKNDPNINFVFKNQAELTEWLEGAPGKGKNNKGATPGWIADNDTQLDEIMSASNEQDLDAAKLYDGETSNGTQQDRVNGTNVDADFRCESAVNFIERVDTVSVDTSGGLSWIRQLSGAPIHSSAPYYHLTNTSLDPPTSSYWVGRIPDLVQFAIEPMFLGQVTESVSDSSDDFGDIGSATADIDINITNVDTSVVIEGNWSGSASVSVVNNRTWTAASQFDFVTVFVVQSSTELSISQESTGGVSFRQVIVESLTASNVHTDVLFSGNGDTSLVIEPGHYGIHARSSLVASTSSGTASNSGGSTFQVIMEPLSASPGVAAHVAAAKDVDRIIVEVEVDDENSTAVPVTLTPVMPAQPMITGLNALVMEHEYPKTEREQSDNSEEHDEVCCPLEPEVTDIAGQPPF